MIKFFLKIRQQGFICILIPLLYLSVNVGYAQNSKIDSLKVLIEQSENDTIKIRLMLDLSKQYFGSDPNKSISISEKAYALSSSINYKWGIANSYKFIGNGNYYISNYVDAMVYWRQAKLKYEEINDLKGVANMLSNMGAIYSDEGFLVKSLESYLESMRIAEKIKDSSRIATLNQNIGALHEKNYSYDEALKSYHKALPIFESLKNTNGIGLTSRNISIIHFTNKNYDSAEVYAKKSLKFLKGSPYYSQALGSIGTIEIKKGNTKEGLQLLKKALEMAFTVGNDIMIVFSLSELSLGYQEIGDLKKAIDFGERAVKASLEISDTNEQLIETYFHLSQLYKEIGNEKKANNYEVLSKGVEDRMLNLESTRAQNKMLFDYEITKKEQEIKLLVKDKEIQKVKEENQKYVLYGTLITLVLILLLAIGAINRYKYIKKTNLLIEKERDRSEKLLLNILPEEIAEELKEKGESVAKDFEDVTVFFSDFIGFTGISEGLSAQELVAEINTCFKAFDGIITSYGMEKIKTIGDAYMAAGGLHIPRTSTTKDVVMAGLEMQDFIRKRKKELMDKKKSFFEMRIGIHTGPVVAGIVGDKKFQYDIWGDTVNTASRMESNGEVGKVNISQHTYGLIKDESNFAFEKRSKIQVKGKGEIDMYFVRLKNAT